MPRRYADERGVVIREDHVPESLRHLLPLARIWCIGDDVERGEFMSAASREEKARLVMTVSPHFEALTEWSAIENARVPVPDEVILLDGLALAAAEARMELDRDTM
jgi:hypothetical protein